MNVLEEVKKIEREIIQWRRELHKIPELNLYLPKTTKYVEEKLKFIRNFIIKILHLKLISVNIYLIILKDKFRNLSTNLTNREWL